MTEENRRRNWPVEPGIGSLLEPLAPPLIWLVYFFVVYLATEASCFVGGLGLAVGGLTATAVTVLAATLLAMAAIGLFALWSWRRWRRPPGAGGVKAQNRVLGLAGFLMGLLFALATLAVGLPALLVPTC